MLTGEGFDERVETEHLERQNPLGGVAIGFWRFYTSPMVFGFDPFVGYFAGPLYDTVVDPGVRLMSYRVGSLASLPAAAVLAFYLDRTGICLILRLVWCGRSGLSGQRVRWRLRSA